MKCKARVIAYYLPQFHPFKENDEWWGKGFTEWTNVGKAKPLFCGHKQPVVPGELGYYDLRLSEVRERQAELAREAGVEGFCYWHYWFNGHQLMNDIIDDVLESGKPSLPFCFGWANETWKAKQWNKDGKGDKILIEQTYGGEDDYRAHFDYVKKFFKDERYIRVDGNPFFLIYKPLLFEDVKSFMSLWNKWVKEEGIAERVCFVGNVDFDKDIDRIKKLGFDFVVPQLNQRFFSKSLVVKAVKKAVRTIIGSPEVVSYKNAIKRFWNDEIDSKEYVLPTIMPRWDHSPRSGRRGVVLHKSTPELFAKHVKKTIEKVQLKENKIIMLKSWNEWAEGNYIEPDLFNKNSYLEVLRTFLAK